MLSLALIEEVQRHLDEGRLSQRKIAWKLRVSRGTVGAIANGNRGIYGREPECGELRLPDMEMPAERCFTCGGMVHKPCLLCLARAFRRRRKLLAEIAAAVESSQRRVA
ncbi:MAG: hypothetical protein GXP26_03390 [Planctomycetes bacterium]|nr:hypothetical protein [Planctomycetota bacterium]